MDYNDTVCKFCGNNDKTLVAENNLFYVKCNLCACKTAYYDYAVQAQLAWINRQVVLDSIRINDDKHELSILKALYKVGKR